MLRSFFIHVTILCFASGLDIHPLTDGPSTPLIWYKTINESSWRAKTAELNKFLTKYEAKNINHRNAIDCSKFNGTQPIDGKFCWLAIDSFSPCIATTNYNYPTGSPCVFLTLNKLKWIPTPYSTTIGLPKQLVAAYRNDPFATNKVWLSCNGTNFIDYENIGQIRYYPEPAFLASHFRGSDVEGYLPPIVAVQFNNIPYNIIVGVTCKLWSRDINYEKDEWATTSFELLIDNI